MIFMSIVLFSVGIVSIDLGCARRYKLNEMLNNVINPECFRKLLLFRSFPFCCRQPSASFVKFLSSMFFAFVLCSHSFF